MHYAKKSVDKTLLERTIQKRKALDMTHPVPVMNDTSPSTSVLVQKLKAKTTSPIIQTNADNDALNKILIDTKVQFENLILVTKDSEKQYDTLKLVSDEREKGKIYKLK